MNCFNGARYLREAIDSVYAQTDTDWEIVFLDNASTDESGAIAQDYDGQLRYIRNDRNVSLGAARNLALDACRGEFIAFLDCDDLWRPEKLEKQIPLFADPQVGVVFCNNRIFNERGDERLHYRTATDYATGRCFGALLRRYYLSMPTVMIRTAALKGLDEWFDPRLQVAEEMDLFLRIAQKWTLAMSEEILASYRVHTGSETWKKTPLYLDETLLILEKLQGLDSAFSRDYAEDVAAMEDRCRLGQALYHWRNGRGVQAREQILSMHQRSPKHWLFWGLTVMPFGSVSAILRRLRGGYL